MKTKYVHFCQVYFTRIRYGNFLMSTFGEKKSQSGQTLIEFVLLLAVISGLSFLFLKLVNNNISLYWVFFVKKVVDDPNIKLNI